MGNHTSYFARTLKPESITVFDADQRSLLVTKHTVEVNTSDLAKAPTMSFTHAAIGKTPGTVSFFGEETKMISLDAAITGPVDFMKVDVDGMELEALSGMERVMHELRPKIMIEVQLRLREPFLQMVKNSGYRVQSAIERKIDANFLIVPDRL